MEAASDNFTWDFKRRDGGSFKFILYETEAKSTNDNGLLLPRSYAGHMRENQ